MKHLYRTILFVIACSGHAMLFGQAPSDPYVKSTPLKSQENGAAASPLKSTFPIKKSNNHKGSKPQTSSVIGLPNPSDTVLKVQQSTPTQRDCFTVESEKKLSEKFPKRLSTKAFEDKLSSRMARSRLSANVLYKIPTIVHVVHQGEPLGTGSNITREQVMSQFDVLNEDFRRLGAGSNNHPSGADINIEFVPVLVDPQGNPLDEPGIDRVFGYNAYYEWEVIEGELKPNTQWDPDRYFNIWVLTFGGSMSNYLGYAQFPSFSGLDGLPDDDAAHTDGIVIGYKYFGRTGNVVAPFDKGRTTTHEVGHWLGLRHIWGDGDCSVDDFCADTPNADGPNRSCEYRDSCPGEGPDMVENYMDYSTDQCMNIFTRDQKYRIRTVLEASPRRNSLLACQDALVVDIGTNISDKPKAWFEYTAPEDQVVTVSSIGVATVDTRLSLYHECNTLPMNSSDDAGATQQSELSVALRKGETVKILWENDDMIDPFEWVLSTSSPIDGAACEIATRAVAGVNQVPVTSLTTYWFQYASLVDHQKVTINGNGKEFTVYGYNCDQLAPLKSGNNSVTIYDLTTEENIYIAFHADGGDFTWSLTSEGLRPGEGCSNAAEAVTGKNVIPIAPPFEYWSSYTIPYDGELSIRSADFPQGTATLKVFKNCEGLPIANTTGAQVELTGIRLAAGETVKILWDGESAAENFEWYLESSPFDNGEICNVAKVAQLGTNHADGAPQWFTYTPTKRTNLRISSLGLTEVNTQVIIKRTCDGPITEDNDDYSSPTQYSQQSELVLYGLDTGEQVYILWSEKWSIDGFDWTIEEVDPQAGDDCANAKAAHIGSNTIEYLPGHNHSGNIFWTKFTVPQSGMKVTAYSSKPVDMAIYTHRNCEAFKWIDSDQGKGQAFDLPAGTELLIIWDIEDFAEDFTWTLSVRPIAPGDQCSNPLTAVQGINKSLNTPVWYAYEMSQAGSLKVEYAGTETNIIPYVALVDDCSDDANVIFEHNDAAFVSGLDKGDRVLIYWTLGYPFPGVEWSLQEIPLRQGDICSDPLPATYGLNHADYATQWFTYTAKETGNLKISSRAFTFSDTELYVYDACDGNLLAQSGDIFSYEDFVLYYQSEALLENVQDGQTILIKWAGTYSFEPFNWEITNDAPRTGDTCEDPLPAVEGVNNAMKNTPSWFSFTMPRTAPLTLSSLGYADTNTTLEIYDACNGNLLAENDDYFGDVQSFVHLDEVIEGQTVLIRWSNSMSSEKYTFDWRLSVGDPDPGLVCQFAVEAQVGVNTTPAYVSNFYWYTFTMPEANKKLVIKRLDASLAVYRTVGVTANCDRTLDYAISEDEIVVTGLAADEQIFIFWGELRLGERPGFDWELNISDLDVGDVCEDPIEIEAGEYHSTGAPIWYQYTMPFTGNVHITSAGMMNAPYADTYLEVYDACDGNLIASSDNPGDYSHVHAEVLLENIEEGKSIWIKWGTAAPFQTAFNWKLTVENTGNHAPILEGATFLIETSPVNGQVVGTLVAEDADGDVLSYGITTGNDDGAFAVNDVSGELTIANATKLRGHGIARELEVTVTDNALFANATVRIDIVMSTLGDEGSALKAFPNPAKDKLHLQVPPNMKVHQSYFIDVSGSVVQTNNPLAREIPLEKINPGVYFLKVWTEKGQYTIRIAVMR